MNCTCTWGCDYTAGYTWSTYILCIVYISLLPLSFSPMLLFFVLIKCCVLSVWLSAKVWHGFRLAADSVSWCAQFVFPSNATHTHAKRCSTTIPFWFTIRTLDFIEDKENTELKAFQTHKTHKKCEETKQISLYTYCNHGTVTLLLSESHDKVWLCLIVKRCHCS